MFKDYLIVTVTTFKEYLIVTVTMFKEYRLVTVTICLTTSRASRLTWDGSAYPRFFPDTWYIESF